LEKIVIDRVELTLMPPVKTDDEWIDYSQYLQQLQAAWLTLSNVEPPLNPRLIGEPGLGKTTLGLVRKQPLRAIGLMEQLCNSIRRGNHRA
jgi:MoxR-like ATPase